MQRGANWLYSRVLALLALQLVMCSLLLAPALLVAAQANGTRVRPRRSPRWAWPRRCVYLRRLALASGRCGPGVARPRVLAWCAVGSRPRGLLVVMLAWLSSLLSLAYQALPRLSAKQRFRAV